MEKELRKIPVPLNASERFLYAIAIRLDDILNLMGYKETKLIPKVVKDNVKKEIEDSNTVKENVIKKTIVTKQKKEIKTDTAVKPKKEPIKKKGD